MSVIIKLSESQLEIVSEALHREIQRHVEKLTGIEERSGKINPTGRAHVNEILDTEAEVLKVLRMNKRPAAFGTAGIRLGHN